MAWRYRRGRAENAEAGTGRCDCGAACGEESGLAPSVELAARQFATAARYRAPLRLREALDGIRMTLRLLTLVQTIIVHSEFLGRLDQAEASDPYTEQLKVLVR